MCCHVGSVVNHENGEEKSTCQYHQLQLKPEDYVKTVTESEFLTKIKTKAMNEIM